jgi:Family of unknown function (DUF5994)
MNRAVDIRSDSGDRTTAAPPAGQSVPQGLRLRLDPTLAGRGSLDGGWWPRSRDPEAELPDLIAGLESSLGMITRVALNLDAWDSAPRRLVVDGRRVHVGWFRAMNADTIGVTNASRDRFVLLVVPPQATPASAASAMAMAADPASSARPADLLAASGIGARDTAPTPPPRRPQGHPTPRPSGESGRPGGNEWRNPPAGLTIQQRAPAMADSMPRRAIGRITEHAQSQYTPSSWPGAQAGPRRPVVLPRLTHPRRTQPDPNPQPAPQRAA